MRLALVAASLVCGLPRRADAQKTSALFWAPPDAAAARTRSAFARALASRRIVLVDAPRAAEQPPSMRPQLAAALDDYHAMRLDAAITALEALAAEAARTGGGDLDRRSLGELFLVLALSDQERGRTDLAWDAFVSAARLDPTRTLDPAQVPPRATAVHRRALAELAKAQRVEVALQLPPGCHVVIDGEAWASQQQAPLLPVGRHYVQVQCDGYEPWRGTLSVAPPTTSLAPALQPLSPPTLEALRPALAGAPLLLAALLRASVGSAWRLSVTLRAADGRTSAASDDLVEGDEDRRVEALLDATLGRVDAPITAAPPTPARKPSLARRWWLWTAVGVSVAALAIGLPVGLTRDHGAAPGTAGGPLESFR